MPEVSEPIDAEPMIASNWMLMTRPITASGACD